jgi:hypothetical protein
LTSRINLEVLCFQNILCLRHQGMNNVKNTSFWHSFKDDHWLVKWSVKRSEVWSDLSTIQFVVA